jgi:hypothetical protein
MLECGDGGCGEMLILGSSTLCIQLGNVLPFCYALTCGQNCRITLQPGVRVLIFFVCTYTTNCGQKGRHGCYIWTLSFKS